MSASATTTTAATKPARKPRARKVTNDTTATVAQPQEAAPSATVPAKPRKVNAAAILEVLTPEITTVEALAAALGVDVNDVAFRRAVTHNCQGTTRPLSGRAAEFCREGDTQVYVEPRPIKKTTEAPDLSAALEASIEAKK